MQPRPFGPDGPRIVLDEEKRREKDSDTAAAMPNRVNDVGSPRRIICAPVAQPEYCVIE